jgi:hypothetical protein
LGRRAPFGRRVGGPGEPRSSDQHGGSTAAGERRGGERPQRPGSPGRRRRDEESFRGETFRAQRYRGRWQLTLQPDPQQQQHLAEAIRLLRQLQSENPAVPEYQRLLALCYAQSGSWGDDEQGRQGVELLRDIVRRYPKISDYRYDLATTLAGDVPGFPRRTSGEQPDAVESRYREALEHARQLDDSVPAYATARADISSRLARFLAKHHRGQAGEPQRLLEHAIEVQTRLIQQHDNAPDYLARRAWNYEQLAMVYEQQQTDPARRAAAEQLQLAIDDLNVILQHAEDGRLKIVHFPLAKFHHSRARVLRALGETELAAAEELLKAEHFEQANAVRRQWPPVAGGPASPE